VTELAPLAWVDVESGQFGARLPAGGGCLVVRGGLAGHWFADEDDLVLLAGLAVGVVEHDVAGVGEDAEQAGDLDGDAGFIVGLAFGASAT
jgi:hypothetical protein